MFQRRSMGKSEDYFVACMYVGYVMVEERIAPSGPRLTLFLQ